MREAVRSGRRANFYITENSFIDHYARDVGTTGVAVYHVLERHANCDTRSTWIGTAKMAELLNLDQRTIQRTIKKLESLRLIRIVRSANMTTFFVVPVPPRSMATTTPLFDEMSEPPVDEDDTDVATPTRTPQETTVMSPTATFQSRGATSKSQPDDFRVAAYKEEQDLLNKTQEQDLKGNKTLEQEATEINASAVRVIGRLGLPDTFVSAAVSAVKAEIRQTGLSVEDVAARITTAWNGARGRGVPRERFLVEFLAQMSAHQIVEDLNLPATNTLVSIVTAAINAEAKYTGLRVEEAAARITQIASEDRENGTPIDKFYFEDAKWRSHGRNGKGQQQFERIKRARDEAHAIIDAEMDR
jgi:hypothetical protein